MCAKSDYGKPARVGWTPAYEKAWKKLENRKEIEEAVHKVVEQYGETLKKLGEIKNDSD